MIKLWIFVILMTVLGQGVCATSTQSNSIEPGTNNGKKWRLGYIEGGPYQSYPATLLSVARALLNLGWLKEIPSSIDIHAGEKDTGSMWKQLASTVKSDHIEFVENAYWSSNWKEDIRATNSEAVFQRLNNEQDIDLMIAMGTRAGQDIANDKHTTNTLVFATTDPLGSNIVKGTKYSGIDHVHARVDPTRFRRQIDLFHTIIPFQRLGIVYTDDVAGRSYAALKDVEASGKAEGFELEHCKLTPKATTKAVTIETIACHEMLALKKVDALYITIQSGVSLTSLPQLLAPLNKNNIPTFSQYGAVEVEHGVLISIAGGFKNVARFHAETIAKVLNGAQPGELNQIFEDPPKIALNLETAKKIGYDPPVDILSATDEFYLETSVVK